MIKFLCHRTARFLAMFIGAEAVVVMVGWIFGVEMLTRILPVGTGMRFVSAVLFFFSALALYYMSRAVQDEDDAALVILPGASLVIFLVTVTLLVSSMLGTSTGIENLFLSSAVLPGAVSSEGLPSLSTMVNFILFGLAGIAALFPGRLREKVLVFVGYLIAVVGLVVVAAYVFDLPELYYQTRPMSLNSALSFVLLGIGLVQICRPETRQ